MMTTGVLRAAGLALAALLAGSTAGSAAATSPHTQSFAFADGQGPAPADRRTSFADAQGYVPGQVLVKFRDGAGATARARALSAVGGRTLRRSRAGVTQVALPSGRDVEAAVAALYGDADVEYAQPNYIYQISVVPNDPQYGQLWGLKNDGQPVGGVSLYPLNNPPSPAGGDIDAEGAWEHATDCGGAIIAVLDTGVNYLHDDLATNMWDGSPAGFPNHGFDFVDNDDDPMDENGHGTHVAGTIGAVGNNGFGTVGVCWTARIMALRAGDAFGRFTTLSVVEAIDFAIAHGAKVINMSFGGPQAKTAERDALLRAASAGIVLVAAAGNGGTDGIGDNNDLRPVYPCNFAVSTLVCVAALDQAYTRATFSNFGAATVDVGAPGTNILSAWHGTETTFSDPFFSSWTLTGDWHVSSFFVETSQGTVVMDGLHNPFDIGTFGYLPLANDRAYRSFNLTGWDRATVSFAAAIGIAAGDDLAVACNSSGGDPFNFGTVVLQQGSGSTGGQIVGFGYDLSNCLSASTSVGFRLTSNASGTALGAVVFDFQIGLVDLNTTTFNTTYGTSMAAPHVAGLATMLAAFNPMYTATDIITAIKAGGTRVPALVGRTTTGKAINALGSLSFINAPTGGRATLQ